MNVSPRSPATLLLSPITWRHHWVWVLPMLGWLARQALTTKRYWLWVVIALIAADFYARPYGGIAISPVADLHLDLGQLLLSSTHPASVALFLASATAILSQIPVAEGSSPTTRRRLRSQPAVTREHP